MGRANHWQFLRVVLVVVCGIDFDRSASLTEIYRLSRQTRICAGHAAAQPLYAEILERNPGDTTTSTRLAACNNTRDSDESCTREISAPDSSDSNGVSIYDRSSSAKSNAKCTKKSDESNPPETMHNLNTTKEG